VGGSSIDRLFGALSAKFNNHYEIRSSFVKVQFTQNQY